MSVSFDDFLKTAESLLDEQNKEIDFRNLISRSYYALFHLAEEKAKNLPVRMSITDGKEPKGTHEKIILKFELHEDDNLKRMGRTMSRLKNARVTADYYLNKHIFYEKAEKHLLDVQNLIEELKQLNTDSHTITQ
jgi:uncharacterized protein (UPF0332 family)